MNVGEELVAGDVIYLVLKQQDHVDRKWVFNGVESDPLAVTVAQSMADANKLVVPSDEFLVEDIFTFTEEETDEVLAAFKRDNPDIADRIKSIKLAEAGTGSSARAEVTFTDGSINRDPTVKIKLAGPSGKPVIDQPFVVTQDRITGTIETEDGAPVPDGTKVQIITQFDAGDDVKNFGPEGKCNFSKSTWKSAGVDVENGTFSLDYDGFKLPWSKDDSANSYTIGIIVKSPKKRPTCITAVPEHPTPKKTPVRDPKKLTDAEKKAIDQAIRTAYTAKSGKSKLPDGTGDLEGTPAFIDFDPNGTVAIINPRNTEFKWDDNYDAQFATNEDGTHKLKEGKTPGLRIPNKDLVTNIAPKSPSIKVDYGAGTVTITPPAYTAAGDDTDLASYTISYGAKPITLTRTVDKNGTSTWSSDGDPVDQSTGQVTLQIAKLPVGATITAVATDNGGLVPEEKPLSSNKVSEILQTATVSYDPNGGSGSMDAATLNKGGKYTILPNGFDAPKDQVFAGWKIGDKPYEPGAEIEVSADTTITAQWKPLPAKTVEVTTTVKEPTTVEVPTTVKEPTTVIVPTTVKESTTVIVPTTVKESTTVIVPTTVKESTTVIVPTTVKEPTTVKVPTTVRESTTVEVPTTVTVPTTVKEPTTVIVPTTVKEPTTVEVTTTVEPSATTDPSSPAEPSETTTSTGSNKPNQPGDKPTQPSTPAEPDANGSSEKAKRCAANAVALNSPLLWLLPIGLLAGIGYGVNEAFGPQIRPAGAELNARLQELMPKHSWVGELQAKADDVNRQFAGYGEQLRPLGIALGAIAAVSMLGILIAQACEEDGFDNGLTILGSSKDDTAAEKPGSSEQK
ncbi:hypothetical protein BJP08_08665 [Corynebacterium sp. NML140438]|uniref:hypothetical protein n=1 Tax=Corynebacterium sp. NML140438 TaxID=1906334 RepID=UPI0008FB610D|nr:hypothetical protein [Corynebacterium sp. NML140438]OIR40574.1 hypothetical protein BJP08_08665 [Corynebacterium sp. NML140438]